jgi:hypothetical protein
MILFARFPCPLFRTAQGWSRPTTAMIASSLIEEPFVCICHRVSGVPDPAEVALAVQHALQHGELPVLWDLRDAELHQGLLVHEPSLRSLINRSLRNMSDAKRAFIVNADVRTGFEQFLARLGLPWAWGVFVTWDAALDWLTPSNEEMQ